MEIQGVYSAVVTDWDRGSNPAQAEEMTVLIQSTLRSLQFNLEAD